MVEVDEEGATEVRSLGRRRTHFRWISFVMVVVLCVVALSAMFQPTISRYVMETRRTVEEEGGPIVTSFLYNRGRDPIAIMDIGLTMREDVVNETWGLGFDIRTNNQRQMYLWFYHDNSNPDTEAPTDTLWMSCQADGTYKKFLVWYSQWNHNQERFLKIEAKRNSVQMFPTPKENHTDGAYEIECDMSRAFENHTLQTTCWSPTRESSCPSIRLNCRREAQHFIITLVTNLGALVSLGCVLGFVLATVWVRNVNININQLFLPDLKPEQYVMVGQ